MFFRDVQHLVQNILSLLFFLCPIIYPLTVAPEKYRFLFRLNPFSLYVLTYQALLLKGDVPPLADWALMAAFSGIGLLFGTAVYRQYREGFAEAL